MVKAHKRGGQTLVETSLVLPLLVLVIAAAVELIALCHNVVAMQMVAARSIRRISAEESRLPTPLTTSSLVWGRTTPPLVTSSSDDSMGWKPFRPFTLMSTVQGSGHIAVVQAKNYLFPGPSLGGILGLLPVVATAEAPIEPAIPEER
ncbi:MAG TPA: hypothetical protein VMU17_06030 [Elusimicrobiota bacterium]|nr:hypothetical protein [Elusimicrobiota bacterium]